MQIVDVFAVHGRTILAVRGEELVCGMNIRKISTPYGVFDVLFSQVREACFVPGLITGLLTLAGQENVGRCEAEILEYDGGRQGRG